MSNTPANQPSTDQLLQALVTSQTNLSNAVTQMIAGFNQMSQNISQLVQTSAAAASASTSSDQKPFQKPSAFTGKLVTEGSTQQSQCRWDLGKRGWLDDAAVWATPAMEEVAQGRHSYDNSWEEFVKGFKLRFETTDEAADAKERLRVLFQEKQSVAEYAAKFKEIMSRTGYSSADLHDRFYEHMVSRIKDELVHTDRKTETLDQLINVANDLDVHIHQQEAEKARRPAAAMTMPTILPPAPRPSTASITPFAPPARDPNAMELPSSGWTGPA
uniref:Putative reverse transcriptase-rnase h-integrase n=1 Tax=Moniliophthora roreri TaxID=221103 RepID=A0A0W0F8D9_MONRR